MVVCEVMRVTNAFELFTAKVYLEVASVDYKKVFQQVRRSFWSTQYLRAKSLYSKSWLFFAGIIFNWENPTTVNKGELTIAESFCINKRGIRI